jgi:hypothetical protein
VGLQKDLQNNNLYTVIDNHIDPALLKRKNKDRSWAYGYDSVRDIIIISKTGQISGSVILINGLKIAIPQKPDEVYKRSTLKSEQYWEREEVPVELSKIKTISQWNDKPVEFKAHWIDYIERQFEYRENGFWFMNNGEVTYVPPSHWMYLQWAKIDVGYPDYREANRIFFLYWEACKADERCYGINYLKIRRSGFSFMSSSECINIATLAKDSRVGILSKTGADAKKMFTGKVVPINTKLPFFFKPIMDGMDNPKTELAYRMPASKITRKNMYDTGEVEEGLNTTIDWRNTEDNSYDGEKLIFLAHDESGKWTKPQNIKENWMVTKTCLRIGKNIIGKCMMGSTSNALPKGGQNFKDIYMDSNPLERNKNGQTKSGLYHLFIPMEWNMEGFIDKYGYPVFRTPEKPVVGIDGKLITIGAIDYWEGEVDSLKNDADALNEFYRQYPRTESHAFRDESKSSLFNLTKIYQQIDYNDSMVKEHHCIRGSFEWRDGVKDTEVIFTPNKSGRFLVSWVPPKHLQNNIHIRNGVKYPGNENIGAFGCDSYDISATVEGRGSNGALHGVTGFHMDDAPLNEFFLEYIARPPMAEVFYEDVLKAIVFYGMPILVENNKPRLLYHIKNRGYRGFSMNRPDKPANKLSATEKELGGIPNTSEDVMQCHAAAISSYIEKYIGIDNYGTYREAGAVGSMVFSKTLEDWARFDINNRTKHDASISSGLALMGVNRHLYKPEIKKSKIIINFARYNNEGNLSCIKND